MVPTKEVAATHEGKHGELQFCNPIGPANLLAGIEVHAPCDQPWRFIGHFAAIVVAKESFDSQPVSFQQQLQFAREQPRHRECDFVPLLAAMVVEPVIVKCNIL